MVLRIIIIIIIIHEFHRDASLETKLQGRFKIRLQSHQVHPTMLTIIQLCTMKQKHTKYTQINTGNKSMHSEMGPVWQNPIQRTVRTAHLRVLNDCAQLQYTIQHRTVTDNLPSSYLQTTIIAQMLSIEQIINSERAHQRSHLKHWLHRAQYCKRTTLQLPHTTALILFNTFLTKQL